VLRAHHRRQQAGVKVNVVPRRVAAPHRPYCS
jgi:hypothetical protein